MSLDEMMVLLRVDILQRYTCLKNQQNGGINFAGQKVQSIFMILKWWVLEIPKAPPYFHESIVLIPVRI